MYTAPFTALSLSASESGSEFFGHLQQQQIFPPAA
jgi:hypothetical protein